jgi:serpin B
MKEDEYLEVENDYLQTVANYYDADIFSALFDDKTLKDVNNWVNNKTDGLIKNALDRINKDAILYLINTLLFEADWPSVYERSDVLNGTFTAKNGEEQSAKMMRSTEWKYIEPENATGFVKNYKNRGYSFVGILPNEGVDINEYIASLNASDLLVQLEKPYGYETKVRLPKFEYDFSVNLNEVLINMGMTNAFDWQLANFSKMATYNLPTYNVYIGNVLHQTSITVAEKGTRAGAKTVIEMMKDGSAAPSEIIKYVYLDRPFVYMIIDSQTKLPIFIGHVENL